MPRYNDYELIYLVQSESCEQALSIMFKKYRLFIYKMLHINNVNKVYFDDYVQEAYILMYNIINKFDEKKGKTFTRFYEFVLRRKIWTLKLKEPRYTTEVDLSYVADSKDQFDEISIKNLTELEVNVFDRYYKYNQSIKHIAKMEEKSVKQIYNAIYRIKDKYNNNML